MKVCTIEGCDTKVLAKGLCRKHYLKRDREQNPEKWRKYERAYAERHPTRRAEHARARYAKAPEAHITYSRRSNVKRKYGLTLEQYEEIIARGCAICGSYKGRLALDHCHATGKIRDCLCSSCNNGLGRFADDPVRLRAAADYVESHR